MSLAAQEQVLTMDLLRAITRMSAKERIVYLLLQILYRLRATVGRDIDGFDLPLSGIPHRTLRPRRCAWS